MRLSRPRPTIRTRRALAVAVAVAHLVAATGGPVFAPGKRPGGASVPYPCENHGCGCATSEQGWAGDCCCFTLEQKLAWADANGVRPPDHVRPRVAARGRAAEPSCRPKPAKPSCCSATEPECEADPPPREVKWVVGVFAQKCRGDGPAGLLEVGAAVAPALPFLAAAPPPVRDFDAPAGCRVCPTSHPPPTPPPRVS